MDLIRPRDITDAVVTSSNIEKVAPATYAGGTTYAAGDRVSVFTGTLGAVYVSLVSSNTGNDPVTSPLFWTYQGTAYVAYSGASTYSLGDRVADSVAHKVYESVQNANTGHTLTDTDWWVELDATNYWAMFDNKTGTTSEWFGELTYTFEFSSRIDTLAILNVVGASVNLTILDGVTEVFNEDSSLVSTYGISTWWDYFFDPIEYRAEKVWEDLPNISNPTVILTLTGPSSVSIGQFVVGIAKNLGVTQYGAKRRITDFSRKKVDDFGNWSLLERGFSKAGSFPVDVEHGNVDAVCNLLERYRAQPILLIGSIYYRSTYLFGIIRDWETSIDYATYSVLSIDFEGL